MDEMEYWEERATLEHHIRKEKTKLELAMLHEQMRPSVLLKPYLFIRNGVWYAFKDENVDNGLTGSGSSAYEAMEDFDKNYYKKLPPIE